MDYSKESYTKETSETKTVKEDVEEFLFIKTGIYDDFREVYSFEYYNKLEYSAERYR